MPDGTPDGAEVFGLRLDLDSPLSDTDWEVLSEDEGARALCYRQYADQVRFVRTRAALRRLLAERLECSAAGLRFVLNHYGKPGLLGACAADPVLHFNVSHAGDEALIALSRRGPIGVDIERRHPLFDTAALESQVLSPLELHASLPERPEFLDRWSAKEAALKALGVGVSQYLQQLSVLLPPAGDHYRLQSEHRAWPRLAACRLPAPDGYAAALAWTQPRINHEFIDTTI
ncbi:4'-phosphopantetheinyl transferase family protein [Janthinobacterium sp. HH01]|uniref:4'-phosphopantetheinyl transferase family protein n=1 Tax=Janthinobacterium sp. HH01 TaxID=1198452 RepID=UPI00178C7F3A|nr:4'-phosphopantetheinyl transferase superfamily protein [Janthinobacterium sp. HH01]